MIVRRCLISMLALALMATIGATRAAAQQGCPDCDASGAVTIDELLLMVNIALGHGSLGTCQPGDLSGDGRITIGEIIAAVSAALGGCPSAAACGDGTLNQASEECDGGDDFACTDRCGTNCRCPMDVVELLDCYFAREAPIAHSMPGLMPIKDEPVGGQVYPVFVTPAVPIENPILELFRTDEPQEVVSTVALSSSEEGILLGGLRADLRIPTFPFGVRLRGDVEGQPMVSAACVRSFRPGAVSVEFRAGESDGIRPGATSRLVYWVSSPGIARDFTVSVSSTGEGISAAPESSVLHLDEGGAARVYLEVSVESETPMFHPFELRVTVAANDDPSQTNTSTRWVLVEGR